MRWGGGEVVGKGINSLTSYQESEGKQNYGKI